MESVATVIVIADEVYLSLACCWRKSACLVASGFYSLRLFWSLLYFFIPI
jgi:hypothetical protein